MCGREREIGEFSKLAEDLCEPTKFQNNITISNRGEITLKLGEYFRLDRIFTQANIGTNLTTILSNLFSLTLIDNDLPSNPSRSLSASSL